MRRDPGMRGGILAITLAMILAGTTALTAQTPPSHEEQVDPTTIVESDEAMQVTTVIQCFCGTCSNQTLHDCTCGVADRERRRVAAALASGETPESLIAAYVAEHGPQVRIVPEVRGFDLVGFSIPFVASVAALLALFFVLRSWTRRAPAPAPASGPDDTDPVYRDRLARDLEALDR